VLNLCNTLTHTDSRPSTHDDSLGGRGGLNAGFLSTDDICSNISVDGGTVLGADNGRGSGDSVLGGVFSIDVGDSASCLHSATTPLAQEDD
jgi:hypothetical protein